MEWREAMQTYWPTFYTEKQGEGLTEKLLVKILLVPFKTSIKG